MAETETETPEPTNLVEVTAEIVAAYVGNNTIATADVPGLISSVADQLCGRSAGSARAGACRTRQADALPGLCPLIPLFVAFTAGHQRQRHHSLHHERQVPELVTELAVAPPDGHPRPEREEGHQRVEAAERPLADLVHKALSDRNSRDLSSGDQH